MSFDPGDIQSCVHRFAGPSGVSQKLAPARTSLEPSLLASSHATRQPVELVLAPELPISDMAGSGFLLSSTPFWGLPWLTLALPQLLGPSSPGSLHVLHTH